MRQHRPEVCDRRYRVRLAHGSPDAREWPGPGVHVSYTHLEMHWPVR